LKSTTARSLVPPLASTLEIYMFLKSSIRTPIEQPTESQIKDVIKALPISIPWFIKLEKSQSDYLSFQQNHREELYREYCLSTNTRIINERCVEPSRNDIILALCYYRQGLNHLQLINVVRAESTLLERISRKFFYTFFIIAILVEIIFLYLNLESVNNFYMVFVLLTISTISGALSSSLYAKRQIAGAYFHRGRFGLSIMAIFLILFWIILLLIRT
jgi:hypothetical protein